MLYIYLIDIFPITSFDLFGTWIASRPKCPEAQWAH